MPSSTPTYRNYPSAVGRPYSWILVEALAMLRGRFGRFFGNRSLPKLVGDAKSLSLFFPGTIHHLAWACTVTTEGNYVYIAWWQNLRVHYRPR